MAPWFATLTTLALLLFSGCIGEQADPTKGDSAGEAGHAGAAPADGQAPAQPEPAPAPATPKCDTNQSNYGLAATIGDLYVFSSRGGNFMVVYRESNGLPNLQTEEECATPDTKVAEVPQPLLGTAPSANA